MGQSAEPLDFGFNYLIVGNVGQVSTDHRKWTANWKYFLSSAWCFGILGAGLYPYFGWAISDKELWEVPRSRSGKMTSRQIV